MMGSEAVQYNAKGAPTARGSQILPLQQTTKLMPMDDRDVTSPVICDATVAKRCSREVQSA